MARVNESISMFSGESKVIRDLIVDADNNNIPLDLTNYNIKFIIHNKGNVVVEKTSQTGGVVKSDPTNGIAEIRLLPDDTDTLSGTYSFEVKVSNNSNENIIVTLGRITITKVYS